MAQDISRKAHKCEVFYNTKILFLQKRNVKKNFTRCILVRNPQIELLSEEIAMLKAGEYLKLASHLFHFELLKINKSL
jgi:hypothetical protein